MTTYIKEAWLVILLGVAFGAALAGVQVGLSPIIEQNKLSESQAKVPSLVKGAVRGGKRETVNGQVVFAGLDADGKIVGWVVSGGGRGFADRIELLIGLDAKAERITGLYVLDQKETPGLGNKIENANFQQPFFAGTLQADKPVRATKVTPAGNEVKAVTGATISSESVCGIVNETIQKVREELARKSGLAHFSPEAASAE